MVFFPFPLHISTWLIFSNIQIGGFYPFSLKHPYMSVIQSFTKGEQRWRCVGRMWEHFYFSYIVPTIFLHISYTFPTRCLIVLMYKILYYCIIHFNEEQNGEMWNVFRLIPLHINNKTLSNLYLMA